MIIFHYGKDTKGDPVDSDIKLNKLPLLNIPKTPSSIANNMIAIFRADKPYKYEFMRIGCTQY